jgi:hypothetical protein
VRRDAATHLSITAACLAAAAAAAACCLCVHRRRSVGGPGKKRRANGTAEPKGKLKNAYTMFVSAVFEELKAAGISGVPIATVGRIWQALPEETRDDITRRFNAIQ